MRQAVKTVPGVAPRRRRTDGVTEGRGAEVRSNAPEAVEIDERAAFRAASAESWGDLRESFLAGMPAGWTPDL